MQFEINLQPVEVVCMIFAVVFGGPCGPCRVVVAGFSWPSGTSCGSRWTATGYVFLLVTLPFNEEVIGVWFVGL